MIFEIILFPKAEAEIEDAFFWYESRSKGLGARFISSFETEISRIMNNPFQFRVRKKHFREVLISPFPYVIIYKIEDRRILIHSVFNTHQNPNKKP